MIRRVDNNWAEGKLADRIGIFPISFVEVCFCCNCVKMLGSIDNQPVLNLFLLRL